MPKCGIVFVPCSFFQNVQFYLVEIYRMVKFISELMTYDNVYLYPEGSNPMLRKNI